MMTRRYCYVMVCLVVFCLWLTGIVLAAGSYDLSWWTVDGGGHTFSAGGGYSLGGSIGQPDAGPVMSGGGYVLVGGFWSGDGPAGSPEIKPIYLPIVLKNS
jgi:hypothetical protein